jgi:hypothetical protein
MLGAANISGVPPFGLPKISSFVLGIFSQPRTSSAVASPARCENLASHGQLLFTRPKVIKLATPRRIQPNESASMQDSRPLSPDGSLGELPICVRDPCDSLPGFCRNSNLRHRGRRLLWHPSDPFAEQYCTRCKACWIRAARNGALTVCLLDREPVLKGMRDCDRFEPREQKKRPCPLPQRPT